MVYTAGPKKVVSHARSSQAINGDDGWSTNSRRHERKLLRSLEGRKGNDRSACRFQSGLILEFIFGEGPTQVESI